MAGLVAMAGLEGVKIVVAIGLSVVLKLLQEL